MVANECHWVSELKCHFFIETTWARLQSQLSAFKTAAPEFRVPEASQQPPPIAPVARAPVSGDRQEASKGFQGSLVEGLAAALLRRRSWFFKAEIAHYPRRLRSEPGASVLSSELR